MNGLIETLRNIWKIKDLRDRIAFTLGLILIYRIGSFVVLPGIDPQILNSLGGRSQGLLDIINMFAGGAFNRASVFALGIMPYISASIVMQLLGLAVPYFQKMQREGESGRRRMNQITRGLTVLITAVQASAYVKYLNFVSGGSILINPTLFWASTTIILTAGTIFVMWLGEKITDRGIGNGISLLIMVGIIATLPGSLVAEFRSKLEGGSGGLIFFIVEMIILGLIVMSTILLVQGTRKIPVQYAKRIVGNKQYGGVRNYIPLKVNISGVMPIIFAQAFLFIPATIAQAFPAAMQSGGLLSKFSDFTSVPYNILMYLMVVLFTYFYTALIVNPVQMADDLKRNNGFIPGVKPGRKTAEYIDMIMSRITLPGSLFLAFVAILPAFAMAFGVNSQFAIFFGGTSLLIMVAVVLDTLQQVESHLLMRHYDGLTKSGSRIKGRASVGATV